MITTAPAPFLRVAGTRLTTMTSTSLHTSDGKHRDRLQGRLRSSQLRQRIKSSRWYWRIKLFLKRIGGRELWLRPDAKIPTRESDGWLYAPDALPVDATLYCFGVGDSITFEKTLIEERALSVHAFDPTPATLSWIESQQTPAGFVFHPWAVAGKDAALMLYPRLRHKGRRSKLMWTSDSGQADPASAIAVPVFTIPSIMRELGHSRVDLVKLDVEGAEYDAIDAMLAQPNLPKQLLVEFHHRFPGIGKERTRECIAKLSASGYDIFAISRTGRELSFIRRPDESAPAEPVPG